MPDDSRSVDSLLAEAMGWKRASVPPDARGENSGEVLVPPGPPPWERGPTWNGYVLPSRGRLALTFFVPKYSTDDFALVEQALHDRGLGEKYVVELEWPDDITAEHDRWSAKAIWHMMRAPLAQKATAALSVLQAATNG